MRNYSYFINSLDTFRTETWTIFPTYLASSIHDHDQTFIRPLTEGKNNRFIPKMIPAKYTSFLKILSKMFYRYRRR